ncbi:protein translocase subunit SecF [Haladaptatus caseinilyticus]|uniref:protein translocase subunit SecF n=1 Tax=Haladaptatus caseinilyticus TaxID=2993314 RepID=UPI00224B6DCC|nr:protein translocase subunit SecF [Haladaptatus caseinilyticus]
MVEFQVPEVDYTRYSNRQLAAVPLAVLVLALLVLAGWWITTGAPVTPGIEFTGGTEMRIQTTASQTQIESTLDPVSIAPSQSAQNEYIVTFQGTNTQALESQAQQAGYDVLSVQSTSASFGGQSQQLALYGLVAAFVGMSILVFLMFRTFVPSIAVVLSAFSDIVIPLALMNIVGIPLSLGTVAALLMLIGYSVDSDILLNNHVLRRSGGFYESTYRAMRTGVTMTLTSLSAMAVMALVAFFFGIDLLTSIGVVLVMGLATDLMNTYMLNLSLLRWYKFEGVAR